MGNLNVFSTKKDNTISNEVLQNYYQGFAIDRMKIRYLLVRKKITMLALDSCIEDYEKEGLNEREIMCIKEKTNTFLNYFKEFNINQIDNIESLHESNKKYNI